MDDTQARRMAKDVWSLLEADPAWNIIQRWPGLSGEAKLAWLFLWTKAGGRPGTVTAHVAAISERQGTCDRAGRNSADRLAGQGIVRILDKDRGQWRFYLENPGTVAKMRLQSVGLDQPALDFGDQVPEPVQPVADVIPLASSVSLDPAVSAQKPPEVSALKPPRQCNTTLTPTPTLNTPSVRAQNPTPQRHGPGGFSTETSAGSAVAEVLTQLPARIMAAKLAAEPDQVDEIVARIVKAVADPDLAPSIPRKVAWAIVDGRFLYRHLDSILRRVQKLPMAKARGKYFISAIKDEFRKQGVDWHECSARQPVQTPTPGATGRLPPE